MPPLATLTRWLRRAAGSPTPIPDALWQATLAHYPFLARLDAPARARLRRILSNRHGGDVIGHDEFGFRVGDDLLQRLGLQGQAQSAVLDVQGDAGSS